ACWGSFNIEKDSIVIFEGANENTHFALMSHELLPIIQNKGKIIVRKGILRLQGTPMLGGGEMIVEKDGTFEFDPRQESTFGTSSTSDPCIAIRNQGKLNLLSGRTRFTCGIISLGMGLMNVGM